MKIKSLNPSKEDFIRWSHDNTLFWKDTRPDMFWHLRLFAFLKRPFCWILGHKRVNYIDFCFRCFRSNFSIYTLWNNKPEDFLTVKGNNPKAPFKYLISKLKDRI